MTDSADLVEVAYVPDRPQAEMIRGLLESNGIPSLLQQTGINGPLVGYGLLPDVPQRVMVDPSQVDAARTLLANQVGDPKLEAALESASFELPGEMGGKGPRNYNIIGAYARIWAWSIAAMGAAFGIFLLLRAL